MDDNSNNRSKLSGDSVERDDSVEDCSVKDSDYIQKLRSDCFHLRLRCYNLDEQLSKCKCDRLENEFSNKDFFDQRAELGKVMQLHQNLAIENEKLLNENQMLIKKSTAFNETSNYDEFERLKVKYTEMKDLLRKNGTLNDVTESIMKENDDLVQSKISLKMIIRSLEEKLAAKNASVMDNESHFRKSLANSLSKMFKDTNESSFHNFSRVVSTSCIQCDELKVYSDKLSESIIKMSVEFQSLNNVIEEKNNEIKNLEKQILLLNIDQIKFQKFKFVAKDTLRKYGEEKERHKLVTKQTDELIEFYIKEHGVLQEEINNLKNQLMNSSEELQEREKLGDVFENKLKEINEVTSSLTSMIAIGNNSLNKDYNQVGQYSPQYRIRADCASNSTINSDLGASFYDKNITLNDTAFMNTSAAYSPYEDIVNQGLLNMKRKLQELAAIVNSYTGILDKPRRKETVACEKKDKSCLAISLREEPSSIRSNKSEIVDNELSVRDDILIKIYEEEKQNFQNLLKEKESKVHELSKKLHDSIQENKKSDKCHELLIQDLSSKYNSTISQCTEEIRKLKELINDLEKEVMEKNDIISQYDKENKQLKEDQRKYSLEMNKRVEDEVAKNDTLKDHLSILGDAMTDANENFYLKAEEMEKVFQRVKTLIQSRPDLFAVDAVDDEANSMDIKYIWQMLDLIEESLNEKKGNMEDEVQSVASWKETQFLDDGGIENSFASKGTKNMFYTSTLNLMQGDGREKIPVNDLTNITDLNEEHVPEIQEFCKANKDKFKYIRENPELIHKKLTYYYETSLKLKEMVKQKHKENKLLSDHFKVSVTQPILEMTQQIDQFKDILSKCKVCLEQWWDTLPEEVTQELSRLNVL